MVHCHVCLGDEEGLKGYVAHLKEATVRLTAEIKIEVYKEKVFRKLDEKLGLMLLDLPPYSSPKQGSSQPAGSSNNFPLGLVIPLAVIILGLLAIIMF